jgi:HPt (histidine-containing phosphotransfer) domain-containing protein
VKIITTSQPPNFPARSDAPLAVPELRDRCMGSADIAVLILRKLEEQLTRDVPELENSLRLRDVAAIARTAHAMKGAAGAAAAPLLRELAATVELLARNQSLDPMIDAMNDLKTEIDRCMAFLPRARAELKRSDSTNDCTAKETP